jgi:hypothetical protein
MPNSSQPNLKHVTLFSQASTLGIHRQRRRSPVPNLLAPPLAGSGHITAGQKVRVRRLTLAPSVGTGEKQTEEENDQHRKEERRNQEHLVRITEVALTASTSPWRPRVHGVEQWQGSKFWASNDDDESSGDEQDQEGGTPTLLNEALAAGFTIDLVRQAEEELETSPTSTSKVRPSLKEGSISK